MSINEEMNGRAHATAGLWEESASIYSRQIMAEREKRIKM